MAQIGFRVTDVESPGLRFQDLGQNPYTGLGFPVQDLVQNPYTLKQYMVCSQSYTSLLVMDYMTAPST